MKPSRNGRSVSGIPPDAEPALLPYLSVIVPCRNEGRSIERCLESILASNYPADRMEVLVVDGLSRDGTPELVDSLILQRLEQGDRRVRRIDNPERITPVALNRGVGPHGAT